MSKTEIKAHLVQYGCRLNQAEGSSLISSMPKKNIVSSALDEADYIIFNTCTVTNKADQQSLYEIRRAKRINPLAKIIVTGCFASTDKSKLSLLPEVDHIFDNNQKSGILDFIASNITPEANPFSYSFSNRVNKSRVSIKIQDGCNRNCSYCKIPQARGKAVSRPFQQVLNEAESRIKQGYNELILTGVNMGWYRTTDIDFSSLLQKICNLEGLFHVRLSSIEPGSLRNNFFEVFHHHKVAQFLHVPLQSGADKVLRAMKRGYTKQSFLDRIEKVKSQNPLIHLGTDIIVGFPGESTEDFEESCQYLQKLEFSNIHIFPYSSRNNTSIQKKIEEQEVIPVDKLIIRERVKKLQAIKADLYKSYLKKTASNYFKAVVEQKQDRFIAVTENYIKVPLPVDDDYLAGDYVRIQYNEQGKCLNVQALDRKLAS